MVLFGSVHLLPRGLDWRPEALDLALTQATDIWFELPIDQATDETARRLVANRGRLPPGDTLWAHLTGNQKASVEMAAVRQGLPLAALSPLRPWMAEVTLELAADGRAGASASEGVEPRIQSDAPPNALRHALETVDQQIGYLADGAPAEQAASLAETAHELSTDEEAYARTVGDWMKGDLDALRRDDLEPLRTAAPGVYRSLIVDRNRRWARSLARLANRPGVTVVVVGVGHLIGPEGVPALLRARGLPVEGP
jgi:uncharacterized protein YbaP (TraB family)